MVGGLAFTTKPILITHPHSLPLHGKDDGLLFSQRKATAINSHSGKYYQSSGVYNSPRPENHQPQISINFKDKFNCQESCIHSTPESVDHFFGEAINVAYNASHYHTLARLLTPAHACCLSSFKVTKIQSHLRSSCYLKKRLAQNCRHIIDLKSKYDSQWFTYEWTLLMICLAHKLISRRLNPHQKYKTSP